MACDLNVMGEAIQLLECEVDSLKDFSKNKQKRKQKTHTALTLKEKMLNWTKLKCKTSAHQKTHFRTLKGKMQIEFVFVILKSDIDSVSRI